MARKRLQRAGLPLYPEHPVSEHQLRVRRAREIMAEDKLDVLLLGRNVNVFYATGSRFVFVGKEEPVSLAPQSVAIITRDADIYSQRFGPFDSDEVALHTTTATNIELYDDEFEIVNILRDYGVGRGTRIGTEWGAGLCVGVNPLKFLALIDRIQKELQAEVVDGTHSIWKWMAIKSPLEVERMRVAVRAAAHAMERIYDVIEVGMNEVDVARKVSGFMLDEGADTVTHAQVMAEGDGRQSFLSCNALDRPVNTGWVHLDIGGKYKRYGSDINRGIFLGRQPTVMEEKLYACRKGMNELMDRAIRPGVAIDDLLEEMRAFAQSEGCVLKELNGSLFGGHGIGLEPYQRPNLVPSVSQPEFAGSDGKVRFQPGMMFTYEMPVELPGGEYMPFFNTEDNVVVTETGVENLNADLSRELRVKIESA
jgi:Xaa-Pro aminopeptidase